MFSEQTGLWYCDNVVGASWQFFLLVFPLAGAFLYGREKYRIAWILIGFWIAVMTTISALTNFVFTCSMGE